MTNSKIGQRAQQREATRARILECALETFAVKGFAGANIRDISAKANVNHGLIKYYFQNKDQLWKEAVAFSFERQRKEIRSSPEELKLPTRELLALWIKRYVRYSAKHPEHSRIMNQEAINDSPRLAWAVEEFLKRDNNQLKELFGRAIAEGIIPEIEEYSLRYIVVALAQTPFMLAREMKLLYGVDANDEAIIEKHAEIVISLLLR